MSKYSLDIERLLSLLPVALRNRRLVMFMRCVNIPLGTLHLMFTQYRQKKEYRLLHNGQVFSLKQVVCDYCGNNGCYITDGTYINEILLPTNAQGELINHQVSVPSDNSGTPQVWVPSKGLSQVEQADFIVHLPQSLYGTIDERELRAIIDDYKLAGKQYSIVYEDVTVTHHSFSWTNDVCALELEPVVETYNFEWRRLVCVLEENYEFEWKNIVCVKDCEHTFAWSNVICAKTDAAERPYQAAWSNGICVKVSEDPHKFEWSGTVCVKVTEEPYDFKWSDSICRLVKEEEDAERE